MGFLEGKKAAVTGGSGPIGRAIALKLAREGAAVAILYGNSGEAARETVKLVMQGEGTGLAVQADLSREERDGHHGSHRIELSAQALRL